MCICIAITKYYNLDIQTLFLGWAGCAISVMIYEFMEDK
jgi:hypothetical protein